MLWIIRGKSFLSRIYIGYIFIPIGVNSDSGETWNKSKKGMDGPVEPGHDGFMGGGLVLPFWVVVRFGSGLLRLRFVRMHAFA